MKIVSWNVNGIRAVYNKGALDDFIQKHKPDAIFFQEIKASIEKIPKELLKYKSYVCPFIIPQKIKITSACRCLVVKIYKIINIRHLSILHVQDNFGQECSHVDIFYRQKLTSCL